MSKLSVNFKEILAIALRYLARRDYSAAELQLKLTYYLARSLSADREEALTCQQEYQEVVKQVIDYCSDRGYLNDSRFVYHFIESKIEKGYGKHAIYYQLRQKGLSDEIINCCLQHCSPDWLVQAKRLIEKKFPSFAQYPQAEKQKVLQFLLRRGYDREDFFTMMHDFFV